MNKNRDNKINKYKTNEHAKMEKKIKILLKK